MCHRRRPLVVLTEPPVVGALTLAEDLVALSAGREPEGQIGPVLRRRFPEFSSVAGQVSAGGAAGAINSSTQEGTSHS